MRTSTQAFIITSLLLSTLVPLVSAAGETGKRASANPKAVHSGCTHTPGKLRVGKVLAAKDGGTFQVASQSLPNGRTQICVAKVATDGKLDLRWGYQGENGLTGLLKPSLSSLASAIGQAKSPKITAQRGNNNDLYLGLIADRGGKASPQVVQINADGSIKLNPIHAVELPRAKVIDQEFSTADELKQTLLDSEPLRNAYLSEFNPSGRGDLRQLLNEQLVREPLKLTSEVKISLLNPSTGKLEPKKLPAGTPVWVVRPETVCKVPPLFPVTSNVWANSVTVPTVFASRDDVPHWAQDGDIPIAFYGQKGAPILLTGLAAGAFKKVYDSSKGGGGTTVVVINPTKPIAIPEKGTVEMIIESPYAIWQLITQGSQLIRQKSQKH